MGGAAVPRPEKRGRPQIPGPAVLAVEFRDEVLARLLALNAERAAAERAAPERAVGVVRRSRRKAAELAELEDV